METKWASVKEREMKNSSIANHNPSSVIVARKEKCDLLKNISKDWSPKSPHIEKLQEIAATF